MSKTSRNQDRPIGGIDDSYLDKLNPNDPDFLDRYYEAVTGTKRSEEEKTDKKK